MEKPYHPLPFLHISRKGISVTMLSEPLLYVFGLTHIHDPVSNRIY